MSFQGIFGRFQYYAKPDGHDPVNKIMGLTKWSIAAGTLTGIYDTFLITKPKTTIDTFRCFGFWLVPLSGMSFTFASTTYLATNLRGKDDPWNYVIGAISTGTVLHAWLKCGLTTLYGVIFMSIFAAAKKDSVQSGWTFFGTPYEPKFVYPIFQTASARVKKYERGWTQ